MTTPDPNALPFPKIGSKRINKRGHESSCRCPSCQGARNRRKGMEAQRKVAKTLGLEARYRGALANEENWQAALCLEVKSLTKPPAIFTKAYAQAEAARATGDTRPVAVVIAPAGQPELIMMQLTDFLALQSSAGPDKTFALKGLLRKMHETVEAARGLLQ